MKRVAAPERVAFDALSMGDDAHHGVKQDWVEQFIARVQFRYQRGRETVEAARSSGQASFKVRLTANTQTRAITPAWRMRDLRRGGQIGAFSGVVYNIREVDAISDRRWVWIVAESGVAA